MNFEKIKEFIDLAKNEGVQELKYQEKDFKVSVSFSHGQPLAIQQTVSNVSAPISTGMIASSEFHMIKSPFVGTYYESSAPGEAPFVKPGDKIRKGQTLCILEAMKIMNEIESDVDGEIIEISIENESLVEYDEILFKIKV